MIYLRNEYKTMCYIIYYTLIFYQMKCDLDNEYDIYIILRILYLYH